jgi:hypothetical protein
MTEVFTVSTDKYVVREALRPVLVLIHETLEMSVPMVLDGMQRQGLPFSPYLFSTSVRCHLKKALLGNGFSPEDPNDEMALTVNEIPNDGIDFTAAGLHIKMLKGPSLPKASSGQREQFYQQQSQFPFAQSNFPSAPLHNVIVLWNYSPEVRTFIIELIAPRTRDGQVLWNVDVPVPADWLIVPNRLDSRDEDIDISLKRGHAKAAGESGK